MCVQDDKKHTPARRFSIFLLSLFEQQQQQQCVRDQQQRVKEVKKSQFLDEKE